MQTRTFMVGDSELVTVVGALMAASDRCKRIINLTQATDEERTANLTRALILDDVVRQIREPQ
jgi:hypothetical protein